MKGIAGFQSILSDDYDDLGNFGVQWSEKFQKDTRKKRQNSARKGRSEKRNNARRAKFLADQRKILGDL